MKQSGLVLIAVASVIVSCTGICFCALMNPLTEQSFAGPRDGFEAIQVLATTVQDVEQRLQIGAPMVRDRSMIGHFRLINPAYSVAVDAKSATVDVIFDGQPTTTGKTDDSGKVKFQELTAGDHGFFVTHSQGFAAFATWIFESPDSGDSKPNSEQSVDVALVPDRDRFAADAFIRSSFQPNRSNTHSSGEQDEIPFADRLSPSYTDPVLDQDQFKHNATRLLDVIRGDALVLEKDGTIEGRFISVETSAEEPEPRIVARSNIRVGLIRNGIVVDSTVANERGEFKTVRRLSPGYYSLVAARADAFLCIGCRVDSPGPDSIARRCHRNEIHLASHSKRSSTKMALSTLAGVNATAIYEKFFRPSIESTASAFDSANVGPAGQSPGFGQMGAGGFGAARTPSGLASILGVGTLGGVLGAFNGVGNAANNSTEISPAKP